jgi:hypothetical protein
MQSETDLLAQWTGEELFAAGRAEADLRALHRRRGEFFMDVLRALRAGEGRKPPQNLTTDSEIGRVLNIAFDGQPQGHSRRR